MVFLNKLDNLGCVSTSILIYKNENNSVTGYFNKVGNIVHFCFDTYLSSIPKDTKINIPIGFWKSNTYSSGSPKTVDILAHGIVDNDGVSNGCLRVGDNGIITIQQTFSTSVLCSVSWITD